MCPISSIIERGTCEGFGGSGLSLYLEISEETDEFIGVKTEDELLEVLLEEFVDGGLRVGSLGGWFDNHVSLCLYFNVYMIYELVN